MLTTLETSRNVGHRQAGAAHALHSRNHQRPGGAIQVQRAEEALARLWRPSSLTGRIECVWEIDCIVAMQ